MRHSSSLVLALVLLANALHGAEPLPPLGYVFQGNAESTLVL